MNSELEEGLKSFLTARFATAGVSGLPVFTALGDDDIPQEGSYVIIQSGQAERRGQTRWLEDVQIIVHTWAHTEAVAVSAHRTAVGNVRTALGAAHKAELKTAVNAVLTHDALSDSLRRTPDPTGHDGEKWQSIENLRVLGGEI